jgi:hypothetical protein
MFPILSVLVIEGLSLFDQVNIVNLRIINLSLLAIFLFRLAPQISVKFQLTKFNRLNFIFIFILFVFLASALIYAPINVDANVYHLPRIVHWLDHGNLDVYNTTITNQIYQPYLSEVQLLWIYSTFGGLNLLNTIQVVYFINLCLLLTFYLEIFLKINWKDALGISFTTLLLINSLFLQVSMPKNDVSLSFFVMIFVILSIVIFFKRKFDDNLLYSLILASGCMILTKGFGYIYLFTGLTSLLIAIIFSNSILKEFLFKLKFDKKLVGVFILTGLAYLPSAYRNIHVSGQISGQTAAEANTLQVEQLSSRHTLTHLTKFIFSNLTGPFVDNEALLELSATIHKFFNSNQNAGNFSDMPFSLSGSKTLSGIYAAMSSGNLLLFLTLFSSIIVFIFLFRHRKFIFKSHYIFYVLTNLFLSFVLILSLFRWQPWMNRFYIPLFIILAFHAIVLFYRSGNKFILNTISAFTLLNFCIGMFLGHSKQPILPISSINRDIDKSIIFTQNYRATMGVSYNHLGLEKIDPIINRGNQKIVLMVNGADPVFGIMRNNRNQKNHYSYFTGHKGNTYNIDRIRHRKDFDFDKADIIIFNRDYLGFIPSGFQVVGDNNFHFSLAIRSERLNAL